MLSETQRLNIGHPHNLHDEPEKTSPWKAESVIACTYAGKLFSKYSYHPTYARHHAELRTNPCSSLRVALLQSVPSSCRAEYTSSTLSLLKQALISGRRSSRSDCCGTVSFSCMATRGQQQLTHRGTLIALPQPVWQCRVCLAGRVGGVTTLLARIEPWTLSVRGQQPKPVHQLLVQKSDL